VTYQPPPQPAYRPLPPQPVSPGGQPLADFGTRLLAYLIDSAIVTAVAMAIFMPVFFIVMFGALGDIAATTPGDGTPPDFGTLIGQLVLLEIGLLVVLLAGTYFSYVEMIHRSGQTFGKKAMKLRVVPIDPRVRMTRGIAAKRFLVHVVAGALIPFFSYVDGFWQLWDKPFLQTLHDKFAQTVVVKVSP
jgi:uncharacterized RDD family membrane protein YckC